MTLLTNIVEREMFQKLCNMEYRTILKVGSVEDNVLLHCFCGDFHIMDIINVIHMSYHSLMNKISVMKEIGKHLPILSVSNITQPIPKMNPD